MGGGVGRASFDGAEATVTIPDEAPSLRAALRDTERRQGVLVTLEGEGDERGDGDERGSMNGVDNVWTVYKVVQRVHPDHTPMPGMQDSKLLVRVYVVCVCVHIHNTHTTHTHTHTHTGPHLESRGVQSRDLYSRRAHSFTGREQGLNWRR